MAKTKLFGKPKDPLTRGIRFVTRGGAALGAAYVSNTLLPTKYPKAHAPGMLVLGLLGEMFIEEPHLRAVAEGIGTYGALRLTADLLPAKKAMFGLAGTYFDEHISGVGAFDWKAIADEAEQIASQKTKSMAGVEMGAMEEMAGMPEAAPMHENISGTEPTVSGMNSIEEDSPAMLLN